MPGIHLLACTLSKMLERMVPMAAWNPLKKPPYKRLNYSENISFLSKDFENICSYLIIYSGNLQHTAARWRSLVYARRI